MLSQLESGKVRQPSPIFLYKLAEVYGVPYEALMEKTGYPVPKKPVATPPKDAGPLHRIGPLTSDEEEALLEYLTFLRSRANRGRGRP
jgi:transcriptional regulator with XRE-family HTH domain